MSQNTNQRLNTQNQSTPSESGGAEGIRGDGSKEFNRNKYSVENFSYPIDLFGEPSATAGASDISFQQKFQNYVVFYINVSEASQVFKSQPGQFLGSVDRSEQNRLRGNGGLESFGTVATGAGAAVGAAFGVAGGIGGFAKGLTTGRGLSNRLGGASASFLGDVVGGAAAGAATNFIATELALQAQQQLFGTNFQSTQTFRRLKSAIALNVPQNMVVGYRVNYADEELGLLYGNAAAAGSESGVGIVEAAGAALIGRSPAAGAISALTKTALNPRKEQLFKSVDFRRFTFDYQFAPRNKTEADYIRNIINMFKYHMHPEYLNGTSNQLAFLYPSEFDIVYYFGTEEHKHLAKVSTCALAEMTVNYSPNGQFSTHNDGSPTQINLQLTFLELETLTKERFGSAGDSVGGFQGRSTF